MILSESNSEYISYLIHVLHFKMKDNQLLLSSNIFKLFHANNMRHVSYGTFEICATLRMTHFVLISFDFKASRLFHIDLFARSFIENGYLYINLERF